MKPFLILFGLLLLAGCIDIKTQLQPINPSVQDIVTGEDCSPIIFGLGFGTNTVEKAMANGLIARNPERPEHFDHLAVTCIRSIALYEGQFLMFGGNRCIIVTGEP